MNKKPTQSKSLDVTSLLTQDHAEVKSKFQEYEKLGARALAAKKKLADEICLMLTAHATAEEEIFYPAVEAAGKEEKQLVDEASVEHACAKELIAQILAMEAGDELFDSKVKVLGEQIDHHVKEEENEMFPKARKAKLDLLALGEAVAQRKAELMMQTA